MERIVFPGSGDADEFYGVILPAPGRQSTWPPEPLRWCSPENEPAFNGQSGRSPLLPLQQSCRTHRSQFHGLSAKSTAGGQPLVSRSARSGETIVSAQRRAS